MTSRGRLPVGFEPCLGCVEEIADMDAAGLGTTAIQSKLGCRRSTVSRVRALLRAAEARGYAQAVEDAEASQRGAEPFPKYPEDPS